MNVLLVGTRATPGHDAVLRALLQAWGHQVLEEGDGPADVVLLDLDGDRDTVLAHPLRPALGLATFDHPGTADRCQAAGLHTLLFKPVQPAQLRAALDTQAFDYAQGLALADPWIVGVIAPQFMQDWPQQLTALEAAMRAADAPTAHRIAHTLKGLAGNIGAGALVECAARLEQQLAQGENARLDATLADLDLELKQLLARLASFPAMAPSVAVDGARLAPAMRDIAALLAQDDASALKLVDAICPMLSDAGQAERSRLLKRLVTQYDFEAALVELEAAAAALDIPLATMETL